MMITKVRYSSFSVETLVVLYIPTEGAMLTFHWRFSVKHYHFITFPFSFCPFHIHFYLFYIPTLYRLCPPHFDGVFFDMVFLGIPRISMSKLYPIYSFIVYRLSIMNLLVIIINCTAPLLIRFHRRYFCHSASFFFNRIKVNDSCYDDMTLSFSTNQRASAWWLVAMFIMWPLMVRHTAADINYVIS